MYPAKRTQKIAQPRPYAFFAVGMDFKPAVAVVIPLRRQLHAEAFDGLFSEADLNTDYPGLLTDPTGSFFNLL